MADEYDDSGMIALIPEDPARLAVPGGIPVNEIHCTLVFLGDGISGWSPERRAEIQREVLRMAAFLSAVEGRVFSHSVWNADRAPSPQGTPAEPCIVYQLADVPDTPYAFEEMQRAAADKARDVLGADFPRQWSPYRPHIAAAYNEADPSKLNQNPGPVVFKTIRLALGNEVYDYPLTGNADMRPEPASLADEGTQEMATKTAKTAPKAADSEPVLGKPDENGQVPIRFPVLAVEGMATSDGRLIKPGALGHRALPMSILAQTKNPGSDGGHAGAEIIGHIKTIERVPGPEVTSKETGEPFPEGTFVWRGTGVIDPETDGGRKVMQGHLRGNSVDLTEVDYEESFAEDDSPRISLTGGKIAATTLCPIPAFADAYVDLGDEYEPDAEAIAASGGPAFRAKALGDDCLLCELGLFDEPDPIVAAAPEKLPPLEAFGDPGFTEPTPLTVEGERVYGHIATWKSCHISYGDRCVKPPKSRSDYQYFLTGARRAVDAEGNVRTVAVGHLTMNTGHAELSAAFDDVTRHYDHTGLVAADVAAGEDAFGIWVNGLVRPGLSEEQRLALAASAPSGDWRNVGGSLELVAVLQVNTPGYPVPRARVASGAEQALVAAGAVKPASRYTAGVDTEELAESVAEKLAKMLQANGIGVATAESPAEQPEAELAARQRELARQFLLADFGTEEDELAAEDDDLWFVDHLASGELAADDVEFAKRQNWVSKAGGLPPFVKRVAKHLQAKGMDESRSIATAVNVVKKMCANPGDRLNFPGSQRKVNPASIAQACKAVARWEAMKKAS